MQYRSLGSTGLNISEIGFGTGGNAGLMTEGMFDEQLPTVARALELGINYFDTSPDYGDGVSETTLGRIFRELGVRPIITTKVEVRAENLDDIAGHIERSLDSSLSRLGIDYVDVLQIHNGPVAERPNLRGREYRTLSIDDYLGANGALEGLTRVQSAGKARFLGFICRGKDGPHTKRLIDTGRFHLINAVYTLLNPSAVYQGPDLPASEVDFGGIIPYAHAHGVGTAIYSPLAGGVLSDRMLGDEGPHPNSRDGRAGVSAERKALIERARSLAFLSREGESLAQAATRFILSEEGVTTVLSGFTDIAQMEEIVAVSGREPFPSEVLARIEGTWGGGPAEGSPSR